MMMTIGGVAKIMEAVTLPFSAASSTIKMDGAMYSSVSAVPNELLAMSVHLLVSPPHVFATGSVHLISFAIMVSLIYFNRILLTQKSAENANVVKWLILPSYLPFLYAFALFSLLFGVLDYVCRFESDDSNSIDIILYPVQMGMFHWFYEGLALFLTKYGVGIHAIQSIIKSSSYWAVITGVWMFVLFLVGRHKWVPDSRTRTDTVYGLGLTYALVLLFFYGLYALLPPSGRMYYRPAMTFYARSSTAFYTVLAMLVSVFFFDSESSQCGVSAVLFIITTFIRPFVLYHVLVMDSQYWQGLCPAKGNPLSEVWDRLGVQTAITLAGDLDALRQTNRRLPIFHFGLIQMDEDLTFVAGTLPSHLMMMMMMINCNPSINALSTSFRSCRWLLSGILRHHPPHKSGAEGVVCDGAGATRHPAIL